MILYIIATPIGNLEDITLRALRVLREVDIVFAEDTRVTSGLFARHEIKKPLKRYDENVHEKTAEEILSFLEKGKTVALVTDAGTPGISDPGSRLVRLIRENKTLNFKPEIIPIPGPSALITALSVSGISADNFTFLGYPPAKRKRKKFFEKIIEIEIKPIVIYESPHRLQKTLDDISGVYGDGFNIFTAKEMTKIHEEHFYGTIKETKEHFLGKKGKGEFVLVIP